MLTFIAAAETFRHWRTEGVQEGRMNHHNSELLNRRRGWVMALVGGVLMWRVVAYYSPSSIVTIPDGLHLPLALLGVLFLVSSLWAWWVRPNHWTAIFLIYGLCLGIHWGGSVGVRYASLERSLFFIYLAFTAAGDAALLNLAFIYPRYRQISQAWRIALYAPAVVALLLALAGSLAPEATMTAAAGLILLIANLFSLAAGVLFLIHLFTVDGATRRAARLPMIVMSMVVGSVVALLGTGGILPGVPDAWNLALGVVPIALAVALVSESLE